MLFVAGKVDEFYHKLYPGLIAYACRQLGDNLSYLAEDCVQDAVLQSYNKRNDFDSSMAWYAYILKCIAHAAVHHHRKNDSHANYIDSLSHEPPEKAVEIDTLEQETLDRLARGIQTDSTHEFPRKSEKCRNSRASWRCRNHRQEKESQNSVIVICTHGQHPAGHCAPASGNLTSHYTMRGDRLEDYPITVNNIYR